VDAELCVLAGPLTGAPSCPKAGNTAIAVNVTDKRKTRCLAMTTLFREHPPNSKMAGRLSKRSLHPLDNDAPDHVRWAAGSERYIMILGVPDRLAPPQFAVKPAAPRHHCQAQKLTPWKFHGGPP
jgi:hypothetical protein